MSHAYSDELAQPVRPREAHARGITNGQLFEVMRRIADACFDGHVTIMKFTTNWRIEFGEQRGLGYRSPEEAWAAIQAMPVGLTVRDAFLAALVQASWPMRPRLLMPDALLPREPSITEARTAVGCRSCKTTNAFPTTFHFIAKDDRVRNIEGVACFTCGDIWAAIR
jgi:hypothetical protein